MNILFFDFETTKAPLHLPWIPGSFAVSLEMHSTSYGDSTFIINHKDHIPESIYELKRKIQEQVDRADLIVAFNLKFDLHWLRKMGIDFSKVRFYDPMIAEYILSGQTMFGAFLSMDSVAAKYGVEQKLAMVKQWWDNGYETDEIPLDILIPYGKQDIVVLKSVYYKQQAVLKQQLTDGLIIPQRKLIALRCESLRVSEDIEWNGMLIDTELTQGYSDSYGATYTQLDTDLNLLIRKTLAMPNDVMLNLGSGDHLSAVLFGGVIKYEFVENVIKTRKVKDLEIVTKTLKSGVVKKYQRVVMVPEQYEGTRKSIGLFETKGFQFKPGKGTETAKEGYWQTNKDQMFSLPRNTQDQKDLLAGTAQLSNIKKMKGTYFDGLLNKQIEGLVHPSVNETITKTGRYSSSEPNLQNVPRGTTSPIKECFISRYEKDPALDNKKADTIIIHDFIEEAA